MEHPKASMLVEASWEVCNKVGGIYTVLKSKAALMKKNYQTYVCVGPYKEEHAKTDFEQRQLPTWLKGVAERLEQEGVRIFFGSWLIEGAPDTILVDASGLAGRKDAVKKALWDGFRVDSLYASWEFEEPVLWSWAVGMLVEQLWIEGKKSLVLHVHEWLSSSAVLYLRRKGLSVPTVFTTHATMLGRSLAGGGVDLYANLSTINPEREAYARGIQDKFTMERAAARNASVFTTVSEITGLEAEHFLGRKPDVLLYNGLDVSKFPTLEDAAVKHVMCKEKVEEFLQYYFFPYYTFDLSHNLVFFIIGRYEFANKGIDLFIEALGNLNRKLAGERSKRTVTAFFWIPTVTEGIRVEVLKNKNYFRHIKNHVHWHGDTILKNIVSSLVASGKLSAKDVLSKDFLHSLKKDYVRFKQEGVPALSTHSVDEGKDAIIQAFRRCGLNNLKEDRVKVVFYPVYLDGNDSMISLPYYDAMAGCHLGVFPSYYEPWGYTPLEAAAMGVPSITTDLAGFGRFLLQEGVRDGLQGISVLRRMGRSWEEQVRDLTKLLEGYAKRKRPERVALKSEAKVLASKADWGTFVEAYFKAHNTALSREHEKQNIRT
ncbi:glycosyltransferase [Candidatus Woesearchaeota archaeon]|nr:MAG: glycosyltransferase [Candidatus Woesearchaeota archaeon]